MASDNLSSVLGKVESLGFGETNVAKVEGLGFGEHSWRRVSGLAMPRFRASWHAEPVFKGAFARNGMTRGVLCVGDPC